MNLSDSLFIVIGLFIAGFGLVFLLLPQQLSKLNNKLNTPIGGQEIMSIRLGFSRELNIEEYLNKRVGYHDVSWDQWAYSHPKKTGISLTVLGLAILLLTLFV